MRVRPSAPPEYRCSGRINYPRFFVPDLLTLVRALNWPYRPRDNGRDFSAWGSSASSSLRFGINALENVRRDGPLGPLFPRMCCRTRCRIASDAGSVCRRPGLCRLSHREPSPQRPGTKRSTPLDGYAAHSPVRGGPPQMNLASLLRFCAVAVSNTSSLAPLKPRSRRRSSLRMRFICANLTSTFLRSRHESWKASVLARARTCSRTSSSMSRETLRAGAVVHLGLSLQIEQSFVLARYGRMRP